jgi:hypothetical protein
MDLFGGCGKAEKVPRERGISTNIKKVAEFGQQLVSILSSSILVLLTCLFPVLAKRRTATLPTLQ